jgi:ribosomal protein S18 acetylase RimI-like enzyme
MRASAAEAAGYRIRRATGADGSAVARELAAYLAFLGETLDADGIDRDIARWQSVYDGEQGVLLVVIEPGGEVVGTAAVRRLQPGIGELKRMWVRPAHQGKGLGRPLMDACLAEARALGFQRLRLDSERKLEAAVHLYRAYGFVEVADYNRNPRAEIWMERAL